MLHKLNEADLVTHRVRKIVDITPKGERIGNQMKRNTRLLEVLMKDALKIESDMQDEKFLLYCPSLSEQSI